MASAPKDQLERLQAPGFDPASSALVVANYALMGVYLDPGVRQVAFTFRPRSALAGAAVSACGVVIAAALLLAHRRAGREATPERAVVSAGLVCVLLVALASASIEAQPPHPVADEDEDEDEP